LGRLLGHRGVSRAQSAVTAPDIEYAAAYAVRTRKTGERREGAIGEGDHRGPPLADPDHFGDE